MRLIWLLTTLLLTGCGGGSVSGGDSGASKVRSQQEGVILAALDRLTPDYRKYVTGNARVITDGPRTSARAYDRLDQFAETDDEGFIFIGPDFAHYTLTWQASVLVHEAAHIELGYDIVNGRQINTPSRERDAIVRQADALGKMGAAAEQAYVLSLDGTH